MRRLAALTGKPSRMEKWSGWNKWGKMPGGQKRSKRIVVGGLRWHLALQLILNVNMDDLVKCLLSSKA
jgi:hypothetical protein